MVREAEKSRAGFKFGWDIGTTKSFTASNAGSNKVLQLPKTLIIQGNIFVLNHHSEEVNNSLTIVNLFAVMIQY